jgi:hypothetical protein
MATAPANKQHGLSPAGRSTWTFRVSGLILFLLSIGGAATLLPLTYEHVATLVHNESEPKDTEEDEAPTPVAPSAVAPHSRKTKSALSPVPKYSSSFLPSAGALPRYCRLLSTLPMSAFAKRSGAGISIRC